MSYPEVLLWQRLRGQRLGVKFRRQHPIGTYVADFYCAEASLVVEVDGEVHNRGSQPQRDETRNAFMRENGYNVTRVAAVDILRDPDVVAASIAALVARPLHHACGMVPLPASGEES